MTDHRPRGPYNPLNNDVDDYCDAGGRNTPSTAFSARGPANGTAISPAEREALLDAMGAILDIMGIFDPSPASDGASAALSFSRGDQVGGWISVIAIIPFLGDVAKAGKFPGYIQKIKKAIEAAKQNPRLRKGLEPLMRQLAKAIDLIAEIKGPMGETLKELKVLINDFLGKGVSTAKVVSKSINAGMKSEHFLAVLEVAKKNKLIIAFRNTNAECLKYIKLGFPAKPGSISAHTFEGLVRAVGKKEEDEALEAGYLLLDEFGNIFKRGVKDPKTGTYSKEIVKGLSGAQDWRRSGGYVVIEPKNFKPLTGDYDLLAVIDPADYRSNMLALVVSNKEAVKNITNPKNEVIIKELNEAIGDKRVLHGAHEYFDSISNSEKVKDVTLFFPDGKSTLVLDAGKPVSEFYEEIGRYHKGNPPSPGHGSAGFPGWQKSATVIKGGEQ